MLKKILIGLAILIAIIVIALYYIVSNIDSIAKNVIEESGSNVLGTPVSVGEVGIKLGEGSATIKHLNVANPPGYSDQSAFSFAEITAVIDIKSGAVKRIFTSQPEIHVEFKDGTSNFDVFNKNIEASAKARGESVEEQTGAQDGADDKALSVQIDEVVIENARATVTSDQTDEPLELTIGRLQFQNLKGSPEQITRVMLGQFVAQVLAETARKMLEKKAEELIEKQGDKLMNKLQKLLN